MATMKQYIISFQATLQGHKMVLTALKGMERQVKGVTATTKTGAKATATYGQQIGKLTQRALMVIPVWLVLRAAMMTVMRTFGDMVRAFIDLDDQLARIRTVMHGSADVINVEMIAIKRQIIDTSLKSRLAIKDLAEGFYFLKTANLDATEAMAAFEPTVNLAIGTMNSMGQSARAVAGIYNTMGQYLGDNLTVHEKFQHIADVLAYTYSTQDVQLSELIQSYTKLAPYITGLSDSFLELTTMLGFLNTRLLRSGRTGRLTGRAILQLTKNAKKLSGIFDITFDPDAPISFLETIGKIRDAMKITGKLTAEQGDVIQQVFATRAGVVVRLLIEHWNDLSDQIKDAIENVDGFAKKMKEIRMETVTGQMARMKNVLAVLMEDFLTTAYGVKNLAGAISILADSLTSLRPLAKGVGRLMADAGEGFRIAYYWAQALNQATEEGFRAPGAGDINKRGMVVQRQRRAEEIFHQIYGVDIKKNKEITEEREKYLKNEEKIKTIRLEQIELYEEIVKIGQSDKSVEEKQKLIKELQKETKLKEKLIFDYLPKEQQAAITKRKAAELTEVIETGILGRRNIQIQQEKALLNLMKIRGASTLDIARKEQEQLETYLGLTLEEAEGIKDKEKLSKVRLKITVEEAKYREQIIDVLQKTEIDMLKAAGASQLYILEIQEKRLKTNLSQLQPYEQQNRLLNIQIQKEVALQQQILRRGNLYLNIMERILKASEEEREAMEEALTTLLPLQGEAFIQAFKGLDEAAQATAISFKDILTPFQKVALVKARVEMAGLVGMSRAVEEAIKLQPEMDIKLMHATELRIDRLLMSPEAQKGMEVGTRLEEYIMGYQKPSLWSSTGEYLGKGEREPVMGMRRVPITEPITINVNVGGATVNLPTRTAEDLKGLILSTMAAAGIEKLEEALDSPMVKDVIETFFWGFKEKGH